jgi:ribosomal protein S12 methylthiotransferase
VIPLKIHTMTIGCDKNLVDSEILLGKFKNRGLLPTLVQDDADVWVLNTCGFIDAARKDSYDAIADLCNRKDGRTLIVIGCLSQEHSQEISDRFPEVDHIAGVGNFDQVIETVFAGKKLVEISDPDLIEYSGFNSREILTPPHIAFVKISEGCNYSCSFCRIPRIRGKQQSRLIVDIVSEVRNLAANGVVEIMVVSQNTSDFGRDTGENLLQLVTELSKVDGIIWIRLLYLYPGIIKTEDFLKIMSTDKIVPYLDMPIQHASPNLLRAMNRPFDINKTKKLFHDLRNMNPAITLRTTILLGFPGEEESDIELTADLMNEIRFDHLGTYRYSPEEGTSGAKLELTVDQEEVVDREARLMDLQSEHSLQRQLGRKNSDQLLLIDSIEPATHWKELISDFPESGLLLNQSVAVARSVNLGYEIDGVVLLDATNLQAGQWVNAKLVDVTAYDAFAVQNTED